MPACQPDKDRKNCEEKLEAGNVITTVLVISTVTEAKLQHLYVVVKRRKLRVYMCWLLGLSSHVSSARVSLAVLCLVGGCSASVVNCWIRG